MNYWPAEPTALDECTEPLIRMVRELAITGERTAREMYGARGWVAHHNTDGWRATAPVDGAQWGLWPMGGAWLCTHLWDRYDYGRDLDDLRSVYPLMRGAALFHLDTLQVDAASGLLVTNPSLSPENAHPHGASICAGPAMDQQILRDLFGQTAKAATLLGVDAAFVRELDAARMRLAPDRIGAQGQLQEWQADWDASAPEPHHRHVSHLYGLFPSTQIDLDRTPGLAAAARRSLDLRGDESTGWATAWRANLWARLRDGERAHRILSFLLGPERTYPNLFDAHPAVSDRRQFRRPHARYRRDADAERGRGDPAASRSARRMAKRFGAGIAGARNVPGGCHLASRRTGPSDPRGAEAPGGDGAISRAPTHGPARPPPTHPSSMDRHCAARQSRSVACHIASLAERVVVKVADRPGTSVSG